MATNCCGRNIIIDSLLTGGENPEPPANPDLIYYISPESDGVTFQGALKFNTSGQTGTIDWGDGNTELFDSGGFLFSNISHVYATSGDYEIKVYFDDPPEYLGFTDNTTTAIGTDIFLETTLVNFNVFYVQYSAQFADIPSAIMDRATEMDVLRMDRSVFVNVDVTMFTNLQVTSFIESNTLESIDITNLAFLAQIQSSYCPLLTTISLGGNDALIDIQLFGCALDTTMVNTILVETNSVGLSGGTIDLSQQTPPAPPSGAGITASNNLQFVLGWNVTTD